MCRIANPWPSFSVREFDPLSCRMRPWCNGSTRASKTLRCGFESCRACFVERLRNWYLASFENSYAVKGYARSIRVRSVFGDVAKSGLRRWSAKSVFVGSNPTVVLESLIFINQAFILS